MMSSFDLCFSIPMFKSLYYLNMLSFMYSFNIFVSEHILCAENSTGSWDTSEHIATVPALTSLQSIGTPDTD